MNSNYSSVPAKILVYSTLAVILTLGMRAISPILTTILFSIFAALLLTPLVYWLKRKGIPTALSVLLVILSFTLIVVILGIMVVAAAIQFGGQIPAYQAQLTELVNNITRYAPTSGDLSIRSILSSIVSVMISLMATFVNGLVNAGTTAGVILLTTGFC